MTGYVNYFSATSLYGAWQAGIQPISPYAESGDTRWIMAAIAGDVGFPCWPGTHDHRRSSGKLPSGAHSIRLMTNLEIYLGSGSH